MSDSEHTRMQTRPVDGTLRQAVLDRLGRTSGEVRVTQEEWDLGYCETCSFPESGFAVYVDDDLVWPTEAIKAGLGGYIYGDAEGIVEGQTLTVWGRFFSWLDNEEGWETYT